MAYDPEYHRAYNQRPEVKARKKAWRQANPDKENARKRRWEQANPERTREHKRKWEAANGERKQAYYQANRARILANVQARYAAKRDEVAEYKRAHYEAHRDELIAKASAWAKAHPEKIREYSSRRRARERQLPSEVIDVAAVFDRDAGLCGVCGGEVDPENWHLDHIVPLARGGHHTHDNVQVCHPRCNLQKGTRLLD